jgi:hypothetical protein
MRLLLAVIAAVSLASCGSPNSPSGNVRVSAIQPSTGSTFGGTAVTISGSGFTAGASVSVGGVSATNVAVVSDTTVTATTAQHPSGPADVVVVLANGSRGALPVAFTYAAPANTTNTPPVIDSLRAQGMRPKQPANMADLNEAIAVNAVVRDAETPADTLTYQWTATAGSFDGSGANVTWRAPASAGQIPLTATLTLTVIERYSTADPQGLPVMQENRVTRTTDVIVHDSVDEIRALGADFLRMFSINTVPAADVVRQFSDSCGGKQSEFNDVVSHHKDYLITSYDITNRSTTVDFGGVCAFGDRLRPADACSRFAVHWQSTRKADNATFSADGIDQVTAVYQQNRWFLCDSDWFPGATATSMSIVEGFHRAAPPLPRK